MRILVMLLCALLSTAALAREDLMTELVLPADPRTPTEFLDLLEETRGPVNLHMVANRGALNPARGSFSIFGDVGPDLTFGIFIEPDDSGHLTLQESFEIRLLIEVITTDKVSGLHNFYELIGEKDGSRWYYRGDSLDVIRDASEINLGPTSEPVVGKRLRCSGCHTGGGLVMKEHFPYNDWRNEANLPRGSWLLSPAVEKLELRLRPASHLDKLVKESLTAYVTALAERSPETEKQWIRSVLAPLEMNLVGDTVSLEERVATGSAVEIPAAFFVDDRLSGPQEPVRVPLDIYLEVLRDLGSSFAADETPELLETQHAFMVPTVSRFDRLRTESLVERGLLDQELLSDLLAVDFATPVYSSRRLEFMTLIPDHWETAEELRIHLEKVAGDDLFRPEFSGEYHKKRALKLLEVCRLHSADPEWVNGWVRLAAQRRVEIQAAQTSANPRGSILEGGLGSEGFRRIFPAYSSFQPQAGRLHLDPNTGQVR